MIDAVTTLTSLVIGSFVGYLYGLSFAYTQRKALSAAQQVTEKSSSSRQIIFIAGLLRILVFSCFLFFLLRLTKTDLILVMISFFTLFWFAIISKGKSLYGGSQSR